ncbi:ppaC [Symbiodinium natans]|uniref:PpaC protein n=1 Tax=Symbiodinium natans TaxID=878477 RepID=A0A812V9P0_9DINO|nr:ppaC [Symbiodinium natans]
MRGRESRVRAEGFAAPCSAVGSRSATTPLEEVVVASNSFTELDRYKGAVFFGHMNPDADSIGSAFGASEFFGGGAIPACPMQREKCPNAESKFLMDHFHVGLDEVPVLSDVPDLGSKHIVLVDFNAPAKGPNPNFPKDALPPLVKDGRWLSPPVVGSIDQVARSSA